MVYFFKEKLEVTGIFKKFETLVEKKSGKHTNIIGSGRRKEYNLHEFDKFCEDESIKQQLTIKYSLQQNGMSQRKNKTIAEMARSMLKEKGLPNTFWTKAIYIAVYVHNKCPTKAVQDKTPIEAWSGQNSSAKHLRVYGSICYIHHKRHELQDKSTREIFMGYNMQSKGYRVYNLQTKNASSIEMLRLMKIFLGWGSRKSSRSGRRSRYASVSSTARFFTRVYSKMSKIIGGHI